MKKLFVLSALVFLFISASFSQTFTGKFVAGSCADNACPCNECYYKFVNSEGVEMTFDKGPVDFLILEASEQDEWLGVSGAEVIPNPKYKDKTMIITYQIVDCDCFVNEHGEMVVAKQKQIISYKIL